MSELKGFGHFALMVLITLVAYKFFVQDTLTKTLPSIAPSV